MISQGRQKQQSNGHNATYSARKTTIKLSTVPCLVAVLVAVIALSLVPLHLFDCCFISGFVIQYWSAPDFRSFVVVVFVIIVMVNCCVLSQRNEISKSIMTTIEHQTTTIYQTERKSHFRVINVTNINKNEHKIVVTTKQSNPSLSTKGHKPFQISK